MYVKFKIVCALIIIFILCFGIVYAAGIPDVSDAPWTSGDTIVPLRADWSDRSKWLSEKVITSGITLFETVDRVGFMVETKARTSTLGFKINLLGTMIHVKDYNGQVGDFPDKYVQSVTFTPTDLQIGGTKFVFISDYKSWLNGYLRDLGILPASGLIKTGSTPNGGNIYKESDKFKINIYCYSKTSRITRIETFV